MRGGRYDAALHYGDLISFDRLVAAVNTILVGSRREEFTRRLAFFEALDILEGFRQGTYAALLDRVALTAHMRRLESKIPKTLRQFLIPRCERALEALNALDNGWYLKERVGTHGLSINTDADQTDVRSLNQAAADYVRLVRNAGHALRESLEKSENRSLLVSHSGQLAPEISDIAFLHFLRLATDPALIKAVD
jgi:hypothetical protein